MCKKVGSGNNNERKSGPFKLLKGTVLEVILSMKIWQLNMVS